MIKRRGSRIYLVMAVVLHGLVSAVCFGAPRSPKAQAATVADDHAVRSVGERLSRCLGREDPDCVEATLANLRDVAGSGWTLRYARGHLALLRGADVEAARLLSEIAESDLAPPSLRQRSASLAKVASAAAKAVANHRVELIGGGRFEVSVSRGPEEVLVGLMDDVLTRAVPKLEAVFGPLPAHPIRVLVFARVETLAATTGLTVKQIRTSGTIAVCKHNRLMITSPGDLVFGYHWADTVVHELVHLLIARRAGAGVPIWLHEAIARSYEASWRGVAPDHLDDEETAALQSARRSGRFITFEQMSPSMAALPSQDAAQLAFAEVHHALAFLAQRSGAPLAALLDRFAAGDDEASALEAWTKQTRKTFIATWMTALRRGDGVPSANDVVVGPALEFRRTKPAHRRGRGGETAQRHVELGDRLLTIARPAAAVLQYRKAIGAGASDDLMMWTRMARALVELARFDEADAVIAPALRRHPHHAPLVLLAGRVAQGRGEHPRALALALAAAWLNPFDPGVHLLGLAASEALGAAEDVVRWRERARMVGGTPP
jgi:hypothetical protein